MSRKICKISFPEECNCYEVTLPKYAKFLKNYNNVLYFEYSWNDKEHETPELEKYKFLVTKYDDSMESIPVEFEYVCSFRDNAHNTYFVYNYSGLTAIFNKWNKMFGGI